MGEKWFGLPKRKITPELAKELKAIKLRGVADPKRFYKANDSNALPKYFTIATEVGGGMAPAGEKATVHDVHPRKGRSLLDSMLRDEKVNEWTRRREQDVQWKTVQSRASGHGRVGKKSAKRKD